MSKRLGSMVVAACVSIVCATPAFSFDILQALPDRVPVPADNPMSAEKIELGKQLFFDARLSITGTVSCNSCHNLMAGGQDPRAVSTGALGKAGRRNAPTLWNVGLQTVLYWDGRAPSLEAQAASHLVDPTVMGMPDGAAAARRIASLPGYQRQFAAVFGGTAPVSVHNIAKALAAFERTLLTPGSPFDRYVKGDKSALPPAARRGLKIFDESGCLACHFGVNLAGPAPGPGIPMGEGFYELFPNFAGSVYDVRYGLEEDLGRYEVTRDPGHMRMWRMPTLRNIAVTGPYFHNGSVATLDEAVRVMARAQAKRTFSEDEVRAVVAFLESLSGEFPDLTLPHLPPGPLSQTLQW